MVTIELFGQKNKYATDSEIDNAKKTVDYLAKKVAEVENESDNNFGNKLSILTIAALNITEKFIELEKEYSELVLKISESSTTLLQKMEKQKTFF